MKKNLFLFLSIIIFNLNAQLNAIDSIDLGTIYKEYESKMRYFTIYNQSDTNREKYHVSSYENHEYFYINGIKQKEYEAQFSLKAHDTLMIGYNFHDLNLKFNDSYKTTIYCSYYGPYPQNTYNYILKYRLGRRLKILTSKINLGDINVDVTYTKQVQVKNLSNKELIYFLDSNIYPKRKLVVPPKQTISFPINFNYSKSLNSYGEFSIRLTNINNTDFDYLIPIEFKAVSSKEKRPVIVFDSTHVTFIGKKGCERTKSLGLRNAGNAPLLITHCISSCGCLVPTCPREPIMPRKKTTISITYDTNRVGPVNKQVTVSCNDPETPHVIIMAKGEIFE